ncbi:hypothetical protein EC973_007285 [Apophysomyces ossiformis]|uniref:Integral membrane protein n=1 Tax=Apophysomyces ossiformis TaxID=679940 RepID=A0A8H7BV84_9FUNG|nr:hypothetical protein EC973_007285 [Apophysomyces ossiformis]
MYHQLDSATGTDSQAEQIKVIDEPEKKLFKGSRLLLFWIPTLCDLTATTVMNVGLLLTSASVYQMLRGAVVIFTGVFSYLFLNRKLRLYEWFSLSLVVAGVAVVGLSSALSPQKKPGSVDSEDADLHLQSILGMALVLGSQLFTASQFVIEEKIFMRYKVVPIEAVGLEGSFGLLSLFIAMPILHVILGKNHPYFNIEQGFHDFFDTPAVWQTGVAISISIAFFNWFGLSITNTISATSRSTIDACRTLFIWMVSLYLGWENFSWIQVVGFVMMVTGTFYFNGVLRWPFVTPEDENERTPLLRSSGPGDE